MLLLPENEDAFQYGLSTLHAWIRFMVLIYYIYKPFLHISYNLSFKKWSATIPENKTSKEEKKKCVQRRFRNELASTETNLDREPVTVLMAILHED